MSTFQIQAVMDEGMEYMRRRNRLTPEDQARANYLLAKLDRINGSSWLKVLTGFYWGVAFILVIFGVPALWSLIVLSDRNPSTFIAVVACIFWATFGLITDRMWCRPRRWRLINEFQRELAINPPLAKVFQVMGFRKPRAPR